MSCKEFIGVTSKGVVCRFGMRDESVTKLSTILNHDMPVSIIQTVGENGSDVVLASKTQQVIVSINLATTNQNNVNRFHFTDLSHNF